MAVVQKSICRVSMSNHSLVFVLFFFLFVSLPHLLFLLHPQASASFMVPHPVGTDKSKFDLNLKEKRTWVQHGATLRGCVRWGLGIHIWETCAREGFSGNWATYRGWSAKATWMDSRMLSAQWELGWKYQRYLAVGSRGMWGIWGTRELTVFQHSTRGAGESAQGGVRWSFLRAIKTSSVFHGWTKTMLSFFRLTAKPPN